MSEPKQPLVSRVWAITEILESEGIATEFCFVTPSNNPGSTDITGNLRGQPLLVQISDEQVAIRVVSGHREDLVALDELEPLLRSWAKSH